MREAPAAVPLVANPIDLTDGTAQLGTRLSVSVLPYRRISRPAGTVPHAP